MARNSSSTPARRTSRRCCRTRVNLARLLSAAVDDAALGQVVRGHFDGDLVPGQNTNVVFTHLARNMGRDDVTGLEFDAKRRIGQGLDDLALELNGLFF